MATEAARDSLSGRTAPAISKLILASTSLPFADRQNATIVASALALPDAIATLDVAGSMRAGTSALRAALEGSGAALVLGAEDRRAKPGSQQELNYGAGAAAILVGSDDLAARYVGGHSVSVDFVDHYRTPEMGFDYAWEDRWVRDEGYAKIVPGAIATLLDHCQISPDQIDHVVFGATLGGASAAVMKMAKFAPEKLVDPLFKQIGDTGVAHPLILLTATLETAQPGALILLIGFGQGCDVLLFEATDRIATVISPVGVRGSVARGVSDDCYNRMLSFQGALRLDSGIRGEFAPKSALTEQYRSSFQVSSFSAGQCRTCGTVQFPQLPVCVHCASTAAYDPVPLADAPAAIATFTLDNLSHHPSPPFKLGLVQFENGARMMMEFADAEPEDLFVGAPLRMVYRVKDYDPTRSYRKYFWKAAPIRAA